MSANNGTSTDINNKKIKSNQVYFRQHMAHKTTMKTTKKITKETDRQT